MFGLQEILIIIGVILGLIFIPRIISQRQPERRPSTPIRLSGKLRAAVVASIVYLGLTAAYVQPWRGNFLVFLYMGIGPVVLGWLIYWVLIGFKKD
jgi:hypothetical protein